MHARAPEQVPAPLTLPPSLRLRFVQDLAVRTLERAGRALSAAQLEQRLEEALPVGDLLPETLARALAELVEQGVLAPEGEAFRLAGVPPTPLDLDREALAALLPDEQCAALRRRDFGGVADVAARAHSFVQVAAEVLGWDTELAEAFARACFTLAAYGQVFPAGLECADLIRSPTPRPYQYEAFAFLRGTGYNGGLVEAPTGSGKTLIGMMCLQDWLAGLAGDERVLILVPTQSYQRQWVRELCYLPAGLQLPPDAVWAGTPDLLDDCRRRGRPLPPVLLMTYAALAGIAAGPDDPLTEDPDALLAWIRPYNVQHVILDEVHKVVQDLRSPSARLAGALARWNRQGAVRNLVGFSGTAAAFRRGFAALGLELVYTVPAVELIAYGFVAPFAELAIPFAYSAREKEIHDGLERYKSALRRFYAALGGSALRRRWAALPLEQRLAAAEALGLGDAGPSGTAALAARLEAAGRGDSPPGLDESWMVALLQEMEGTSDEALLDAAAEPMAGWVALAACRDLARELAQKVRLPTLASRMQRLAGSAHVAPAPGPLAAGEVSRAARRRALRDALAVTVSGAALSFPEWYRQTGEGRVGSIRASLQAEQAIRPFRSAILFDAGRPIPWQSPAPAPGFAGVGGTFAELVRDPLPGVVPMAALSGEFYLPLDPPGLPEKIAALVREQLMVSEIGSELLEMATQGVDLPEAARARLGDLLLAYLSVFAASVLGGRIRVGEFRRRVLAPVRRASRELVPRMARVRIAERLSPRNRHLVSLVAAFYDYAAVAELFRRAERREWIGTDGERRAAAVIELPRGRRRLLMYEMTSRILDTPALGINLMIVSAWARTGWNVRSPNVLIDATATTDVTAWQQLRGRAMRSLPTWTAACARAVSALIGHEPHPLADEHDLPPDIREAFRSLPAFSAGHETLDPAAQAILLDTLEPGEEALRTLIESGSLSQLDPGARAALITRLVLRHNKVTHIYELVKAYGESQVVKRGARWERRPALEAKHDHEESVNPLTGEFRRGAAHAPLLYAADPRADLPDDLAAKLAAELKDADARVVAGWVRAASG
jgi:hypothetical protein